MLRLVQGSLHSWIEFRRNDRRPFPYYVLRAFERWLDCGNPSAGYSVFGCCKDDVAVRLAWCCRGRGFCCFCLTYRQRVLGHHLLDSVIGDTPVRHWVDCFPPALRCVLAYDNRILRAAYRGLADAVFEFQRREAIAFLGLDDAVTIHPAGLIVHHRASATLEPNHHLHGIFVDGVFVELPGGDVVLRRLPAPTDKQVAEVAFAAGLKLCAALEKLGFWKTLSCSSDTIEGTLSLPGTKPRHEKFFGQAAQDAEGGVAPRDGAYAFHIWRGPAIEETDDVERKRLVNYVLAPPFRDDQVRVTAAGKVVLTLKRPRHDGTREVVLEPFEFLDRLAELVPRPRLKTVRYFGAFAPKSPVRNQAVARIAKPAGKAPASTDVLDGRTTADSRCDAPGSTHPVCPICMKALRFIRAVRWHNARQRLDRGVPPDTPSATAPRGQDRFGHVTSAAVQGRLFA